MKYFGLIVPGSYMLLAFAVALPVRATTIDFDVQAAHRGGNPTGIPDSPLTIGIATFTGGELLSNEVGLNSDTTGVYASEGLFGSGETNPLVITFAAPVRDVSVFVLNADAIQSYTVSDNSGDSVTNSVASGDGVAVSLLRSGLTTVTIASANTETWDFAIDNVNFVAAANSTPEPESLLLLGIGIVLLVTIPVAALVYKRRQHTIRLSK
jgi:hypothetical protein